MATTYILYNQNIPRFPNILLKYRPGKDVFKPDIKAKYKKECPKVAGFCICSQQQKWQLTLSHHGPVDEPEAVPEVEGPVVVGMSVPGVHLQPESAGQEQQDPHREHTGDDTQPHLRRAEQL